MIKNKARINKELSIGELKKIIEEKNNIIKIKEKRIIQLEDYIKNNNFKIPDEDI